MDVHNVLSMEKCFKSWKPFPVDGICVRESDSKNSCDGDSGGPLISIQKMPNQQQNRHVLLGILSFGTSCEALQNNTIPKTSVYTRLDFYQQKLNNIIDWKNENFDGFDFSDL
uniref:Peptidase S1 domain-containing protein n=1 Tax=Panagrolaimus sp. ES5 TaxID=591445 RepID=A0AC34FPJ5_9BILA